MKGGGSPVKYSSAWEGPGWAGGEGRSRRQCHKASLPFPSPSCLVQLQQSEAKCEDALKTQKALTADLENMHSELESMTRSKSLVPVPPGVGGRLCAQH